MPRDPDEIWVGDRLARRKEAELFRLFLERQFDDLKRQGRDRAYSIAVHGEYGLGKSTFLEGLAEELATNHPVAWVDAWRDDTVDDPFTSLMVALEAALAKLSDSSRLDKVKRAGLAVAGKFTKGVLTKGISLATDTETANELIKMMGAGSSDGIDALADALATEQRKDYADRLGAIATLKVTLGRALEAIDASADQHLPLFVFIDELDRCRPTYAIRMLETMKHLLDVPGIIFILGVQRDQLAAAIEGQYGARFKGHAYLRRFIDRPYELRDPPLHMLCEHFLEKYDIPVERLSAPPKIYPASDQIAVVSHYISQWIKFFNCKARDVGPLFDMLKTFTQIWDDHLDIELTLCVPEFLGRITCDIDNPLTSADGGATLCREIVHFPYEQAASLVRTRQALMALLGSTFGDLAARDRPQGGVNQWAYDRIDAERRRFGNSFPPNQMPRLNDYAVAVDMVSRMTDSTAEIDDMLQAHGSSAR